MSFERYQPSEKGSESDQRNNNHNGQSHKVLKYAPVQIVQNKNEQNTQERRNYPQLNLRFQPAEETTHRQDPTVTIPLSFLQQLIQQAYSNKQLRTLYNVDPKSDREENQKSPFVVEDLIKQIEIQQQRFQQPQQLDEEKKIVKFLLDRQMTFLLENNQSKYTVEEYLSDNKNLLPYFWNWLKQIEVKALEDMLILCYAEQKNQQYQDIFKSLFQRLSLEFYSKHAFAQIMRQHDLPEKIKYLSMAAEILNKIAKPQEYYYFSRQR